MKVLIERFSKRADCKVLPPIFCERLDETTDCDLPNELIEFYNLCGGIEISPESASDDAIILPPEEFKQADPIIANEEMIEIWKEAGIYESFKSKDCFVFVDIGNGNYIVVDLNKEHFQNVYLANWENYPNLGDVPVLANSISEFLNLLILGLENSNDFFWEADDFTPIKMAFN